MALFNAAALGLLALVPLVVLLYFMKLRRPEQVVSASFLWRRALEQARVDSFFERLKINRLLILQILAITLLALALARPYVKSDSAVPPEVVLVLDRSASMQAADEGKTRFERARGRAERIVRDAPPGTRFMVIGATSRARVEAPFTSDRQDVERALAAARPEDTRTDLRPALRLALSTVQAHPEAQVFVFTDRDRAEVTSPGPRLASSHVDSDSTAADAIVHYVPIGGAAPNLAITAMQARAGEVFVAVANDAQAPADAYLELWQGGRLVDAREVRLPGSGRKAFVFTLAAGGDPVVEARLVARDAATDRLPADNRAWTVSPVSATPKVLLVTAGNPFLERALTLLPGLRVFKVKPADYRGGGPGPGDYAMTVWDSGAPPASATGSHLVLNPPKGDGLVAVGDERAGPFTVTGDASHPVLRYVDVGLITVSKARTLRLPPCGRPIAHSDDVALIAALERPGLRAVVVGFDPYQSDFPLSPAFPIFIANAVAWLGGPGLVAPPTAVRTEDPIPLEFLGSTGTVKVQRPDGRALDVPVPHLGQAFTDTARAGVYRFSMGERSWQVAVNLLDAAESRLAPPTAPESPARPARAGLARSLTREIWWELALVGLVLVMGEWWMYHRW